MTVNDAFCFVPLKNYNCKLYVVLYFLFQIVFHVTDSVLWTGRTTITPVSKTFSVRFLLPASRRNRIVDPITTPVKEAGVLEDLKQ